MHDSEDGLSCSQRNIWLRWESTSAAGAAFVSGFQSCWSEAGYFDRSVRVQTAASFVVARNRRAGSICVWPDCCCHHLALHPCNLVGGRGVNFLRSLLSSNLWLSASDTAAVILSSRHTLLGIDARLPACLCRHPSGILLSAVPCRAGARMPSPGSGGCRLGWASSRDPAAAVGLALKPLCLIRDGSACCRRLGTAAPPSPDHTHGSIWKFPGMALARLRRLDQLSAISAGTGRFWPLVQRSFQRTQDLAEPRLH